MSSTQIMLQWLPWSRRLTGPHGPVLHAIGQLDMTPAAPQCCDLAFLRCSRSHGVAGQESRKAIRWDTGTAPPTLATAQQTYYAHVVVPAYQACVRAYCTMGVVCSCSTQTCARCEQPAAALSSHRLCPGCAVDVAELQHGLRELTGKQARLWARRRAPRVHPSDRSSTTVPQIGVTLPCPVACQAPSAVPETAEREPSTSFGAGSQAGQPPANVGSGRAPLASLDRQMSSTTMAPPTAPAPHFLSLTVVTRLPSVSSSFG
jgi:hypothetical protein